MSLPSSWRATPSANYHGPKIALIHGLAAGKHMQRHLLAYVRAAGFEDASLYSNHLPPVIIAKELALAAKAGQPIALLGYSQGGSQVIKVARLLEKRGVSVAFTATVAAGGLGRAFPAQWGFDMRSIPANVKRLVNFYLLSDKLGSDRVAERNIAHAVSDETHIENIVYPEDIGIDHISIVRCYPKERVVPEVREQFLERIVAELSAL